jgi:thiol-disulfide isomerase/thioredoxin
MRKQRDTQSTIPHIVDSPSTLLNYAAPEFSLPMLDGRQVSLEDYRGKVLFLNFWQTTCVPCIIEMPEFLDFLGDQNPDEVALLAVNVGETADAIREFFASNDIIGIPTALDSDSTVLNQYGVIGFPTTFIINGDSAVQFLRIGGMSYDDMEDYLQRTQSTAPVEG